MNERKIYSWMPENSEMFYDVFDSIEEAVKDAQKQWDEKDGFYYDGDGHYHYSTVIHLMRVRRFNPEKHLDEFGDTVIDYLQEQLDGFTSGCEGDPQVAVKDADEFNLAVKQALLPLVRKHLFSYFDMVGDTLTLEYDVKNRKYLLNGEECSEDVLEQFKEKEEQP